MNNTFLVTKITMQDMLNAVVDSMYGNDTASMGFSTVVNLSAVPIQDRQSIPVVTELLKNQFGENFFVEMDQQLEANLTTPNPN
jgi:hypothetical protein